MAGKRERRDGGAGRNWRVITVGRQRSGIWLGAEDFAEVRTDLRDIEGDGENIKGEKQ